MSKLTVIYLFKFKFDKNNSHRKLLQEQIEKANPRHEVTAEEARRMAKLQAIADKLKRRKNVLFIPLTNL